MAIENLERLVLEHPLFEGLDKSFSQLITGCARNAVFKPGAFLCREGEPADQLYLVRSGRVALELTAPGQSAITFQTVHEGEVVGLSWLVPPYRWRYDAQARDQVRAIAIDVRCLRAKLDDNHALGYELMKRFVPVLVERLHGSRLQMLDLYGTS